MQRIGTMGKRDLFEEVIGSGGCSWCQTVVIRIGNITATWGPSHRAGGERASPKAILEVLKVKGGHPNGHGDDDDGSGRKRGSNNSNNFTATISASATFSQFYSTTTAVST